MLKWNFYFAKNCMHEKSMLHRLQTALHSLFLTSLKAGYFLLADTKKKDCGINSYFCANEFTGYGNSKKREMVPQAAS
jgi:hypothetical protein